MSDKTEIAVFGEGCFWCTEAVFEQVKGVLSVKSGYAAGTLPNPTYPQVSTGRTGHAEVARIEFDPAQISYADLLTVFFATHDPTTLNRQGADVGTEYRSIILYTTPEQKRAAADCIEDLSKSSAFNAPIVTELKPLEAFYPAEDYHAEYYRNNAFAPYCQVVITPKLAKFHKKFAQLLKS